MVSLRQLDGTAVEQPLKRLRPAQAARAKPWRTFRNHHGQKHHSGYYWCATTGGHVLYESRLELARLMLADFDPQVVEIAAQPFRLRARVSGRARRHVPDYFLVRADRSVTVVNVKPSSQLAKPEVAEALAWPAELVEEHGWAHEIWSGEDPVFLANVRFLASQRRDGLVAAEVLDEVLGAAAGGATIRELTLRLQATWAPELLKPAVLRLLWQQRLRTDLRCRLDGDSRVEVCS
ncbi:TnsA-like heteromeric transposase endonuclease subunit [Streptomyces bauhiniae]|uniref:TnsA-like heteromeric transposase endonuclease subunit n=1 Tax=Streptomyces bauhiniae TaxID=2340725 RepID=UPI0033296BA2